VAYATIPVPLRRAEPGWQEARCRAAEQAGKPKAAKNKGQSRYLCLRVKASEAAPGGKSSALPCQVSFGRAEFRVPQSSSYWGWEV